MIESLAEAREEIKRVDHLIFITLKYTRTGDVIINIIKKLINTYDFGIISLLKYLEKNKKIKSIPKTPIERVELLEKNIKKVKKYTKFYKTFKEVTKQKYEMREEYRKYITLVTKGKKPIEVNYNKLIEYFDTTNEFLDFIEGYITKNKSI